MAALKRHQLQDRREVHHENVEKFGLLSSSRGPEARPERGMWKSGHTEGPRQLAGP